MELRSLTINNFKNIASAKLNFSPKANCFLGNNGMGKSNLLDAVYYLSFCKSFSGVPDSMVVRKGEQFMMLKGEYRRGGVDESLVMAINVGKRKSLKRGPKEYKKLSEHIGLFPIVMIGPRDIELIHGAPEERRRWLDMVISQADNIYLDRLIRYGQSLEQRNRMLRDHVADHLLYDAVESTMAASAAYIAKKRKETIADLQPVFKRFYQAIAGHNCEDVDIELSGWDTAPGMGDSATAYLQLLDSCRRHDEIVGHTSTGPHRDDIALRLDSMDARKVGSQGQCKTFTIALRLAQYDVLLHTSKLKPMMLLDDIFDKLDASRVERIMNLVTADDFGQIFVTDTNRTHLDEIMGRTAGDYRLWSVEQGEFTLLHQGLADQ